MSRREIVKRELGPLLILAALSLGALWRVTVGGRAMAPADLLLLMEPWKHHAREFPEFERAYNPILDGIQQFYPWRKYAGESLRRGTIPLWNPYELCGNPFVANNQSAVFYPETWLHAIMPTEHALGWATLLHFFTSGALMYWFLRVLRLRRPAALIGAIAFMFNGFFVGWLCFPSFRSVPAWLPGMLATFELTVQRRQWPWLALGALFVGLQFLAGNLHISLLVLIVFGAYAAFRAVQVFVARERRAAVSLAVGGALVLLVGMTVAAIQLLPVIELAPMSSRAGGTPYAAMLQLATPWPLLLTGLMPDVFGNPVDYNHWGADLGAVHREYIETAWYVGVLPWLLGAAAFLARPRAQAWFWLAILLLGIAFAFGTPAYALFYYLVPGAKALSGLGRAILISCTTLCVLGALGADTLLQWCENRAADLRRYTAFAAVSLGAVGLLAGALVWVRSGALEQDLPGLGGYTGLQIGRFALVLAVGAGLVALLPTRRRIVAGGLVALLAIDLLLFVGKFTPATRAEYVHIESQTIDLIRADPDPVRVLSLGRDPVRRMAPNTSMIVGLEDIQGSDSLEIGAYRRLVNALCTDRLGFPQPDPSLPAIGLLGARYVLSGVDLGQVPGLSLISSSEGWLYRNEQALPRAFIASGYVATPDEEPVLAGMQTTHFVPETALLVGVRPRTEPVVPSPRPRLFVTYDGPQRATVSGDLVPGELVVLTDTYFPGWRAYQDGRECPIVRVDYALRAVQIEQPCRRIDFVYLPTSFRAGAFGSLCGLGLLAAAGTWVVAGRRRTQR